MRQWLCHRHVAARGLVIALTGELIMGIAKPIVLLLALLGSASASAMLTWHTASVKMIYPYTGGNRFVLTLTSDHANCTNAQVPKYYYILVGESGVTTDDVKAFYSLSMLALAQDRQLTILFDDATSNCYVSAMRVE